jgi:hypothetical protein
MGLIDATNVIGRCMSAIAAMFTVMKYHMLRSLAFSMQNLISF